MQIAIGQSFTINIIVKNVLIIALRMTKITYAFMIGVG